ncbi:MAG: UDP-3-O-(3-hydroxymyristoyl)glucosamine N-acyltransferase [Parvularculaceae bacterium]
MPDPRFFLTAEPLSAKAAAALGGAELLRGPETVVSRVAALGESDVTCALLFAETPREIEAIGSRSPGLVFTTASAAAGLKGVGALAVTSSPRLAFARVAARLHKSIPFGLGAGVSSAARIGDGADIHGSACIAAGAEIGARAVIGPNAVIGPGVVIGRDCVIGPNAVVTHAVIGARTVLLAGAIVGEAGFGFTPGPDGPVRVPQLGCAIIGDDVEVGANSCIDRGALGDTIIGSGVKIDNLVQIGHNAFVGPHTLIAAQVGLSGSVKVGSGVLMGGQVGMADHIEIGDCAQLAAQSGVMRNVPPGEKWAGAPAKPAKTWFREITLLARLAARRKSDGHE